MRKALLWIVAGVVAVPLIGCADSARVDAPTAPARSMPSTPSVSLSAAASPESLSAQSHGETDVTLTNAGWTCIQPGNNLTLCAPPGLGLPPIPPAGNGEPTYNIMAFTLDHQFVHHVKLLRPDLYHGEPCLGGQPWTYIDFLNYYECLIPGRGE